MQNKYKFSVIISEEIINWEIKFTEILYHTEA